jgi:hypothetical protein
VVSIIYLPQLLRLFAERSIASISTSFEEHRREISRVSVGDPVSLSNTASDTVGSTLETLDGRLRLVRVDVELDEQKQVAGQDTASEQGSSLSPSAVSNNRQVPILGGETGVGYKYP